VPSPSIPSASPLTENERKLVQRLLGDPTELPQIFRSWLVAYIEANPPLLPISQITGFSQFLANSASVAARQSTSSTAYNDLGTVGPQLTSLADGVYLVLHGYVGSPSVAGQQCYQSISVNGSAAQDADSCQQGYDHDISVMTAVVKTLQNGNENTITCKYRAQGGTGSFGSRFLIALKVANA